MPALIVGILTAPFGGAALAVGLYAGGVVGAIGLGALTGFVAGGFNELSEGRAARREWQQQLAQERDGAKVEHLQAKLHKAQEKAGKIHGKIEKLQEKMHSRADKHSFVGAEMARRSGGGTSKGRGL